MEKEQFCKELSGESCLVIKEKCFRLQVGKHCAYVGYFKSLREIGEDTPSIAHKVRANMVEPFVASLKSYAQKGAPPGMKKVVASPLEIALRAILKSELSPLGVSVSEKEEVFKVWQDCRIRADGIARKKDCPTCIFSFKTWVGSEQVRETFAYAYFAKTWLGQQDIRVYEIGLQKYTKKAETKELDSLVEVCKPYLDGVFYLTTVPYLDDLITELQQMYSGHKMSKTK